jgi:hypothetical protein
LERVADQLGQMHSGGAVRGRFYTATGLWAAFRHTYEHVAESLVPIYVRKEQMLPALLDAFKADHAQ